MVTVSGRGGEVRIGYQTVAELGTWTLRDELVTAAVASVDTYWMDQPYAKALRLPVGRSTWIWRDVNVSVAGTTLLVRVSGSPEQR